MNIRAAVRFVAFVVLATSVVTPMRSLDASGPIVISVGTNPWGVAVNSITNRAYVANQTSSSISVIDTVSHTVLTTISGLRPAPTGVAVDTDTNKIYVTHNQSSGGVTIIDGTNAIITSHTVSNGWTSDVAVNSATDKVYVPNEGNNTVSVLSTATDAILGTISGGFSNPS